MNIDYVLLRDGKAVKVLDTIECTDTEIVGYDNGRAEPIVTAAVRRRGSEYDAIVELRSWSNGYVATQVSTE